MSPLAGAAAILALLLVALLAGVLLKRRGARVREVTEGARIDPAEFGATALGPAGTVVQFSTEFCARCPGVRRTLAELVRDREALSFIHVDVTDKPALAKKYGLLQTPTVLFVGADGVPNARLSGTLTRGVLAEAIDRHALDARPVDTFTGGTG